ncbi:hypothetical protein SDC9_204650 [bioreactor metagenome]|uniref:Uncharacterized protein n=1 Tax=bioreactor metagenome TaxID=1076179 RepID=A0A645J0I2_9ZZZZ
MRQIGRHEHEVARLEAADEIPDEILARRFGDQLDFEFRMEMPADCPERIAMPPHLERFVLRNIDHFQIWFHSLPLS